MDGPDPPDSTYMHVDTETFYIHVGLCLMPMQQSLMSTYGQESVWEGGVYTQTIHRPLGLWAQPSPECLHP